MSREIKFRYVFKRKTDGHIYIIEFNVEALEDKETKIAELSHGKMLIGLVGTTKATEIIGSYHAVRRIKSLDQRISLDMILKANDDLANVIIQGICFEKTENIGSVSQIKTMLRNDLWKLVARDQFTGLKDKNELELYADDIIDITRYEETTRHQIIWKEGGWQLNPPGPFPTQYLGCFKSAIIEKKAT